MVLNSSVEAKANLEWRGKARGLEEKGDGKVDRRCAVEERVDSEFYQC